MTNEIDPTTPPEAVTWLTPGQAAERLQISEATIYQHIKNNPGPWRRLGRLWRIHPDSLLEWTQSFGQ